MVGEDKQTSHDSTSLCQKTWESSVSAHGPCQWVKRTSWMCVYMLMSSRSTRMGGRREVFECVCSHKVQHAQTASKLLMTSPHIADAHKHN